MHEFALADAVVTTALEVAAENGITTIDRIVVTVGELQQIERELFEFSLTQVIPQQEPALHGAEFEIREDPARFSCRVCERSFGPDDVDAHAHQHEAAHFVPELSHAFVRCPECGSPDFEITAGRGVTLHRVEGTAGDEPTEVV